MWYLAFQKALTSVKAKWLKKYSLAPRCSWNTLWILQHSKLYFWHARVSGQIITDHIIFQDTYPAASCNMATCSWNGCNIPRCLNIFTVPGSPLCFCIQLYFSWPILGLSLVYLYGKCLYVNLVLFLIKSNNLLHQFSILGLLERQARDIMHNWNYFTCCGHCHK